MQERLTGYISYMLNKFRTISEWRNSWFAKMKWTKISVVLANDDDSLHLLLSKMTYSLVYDIHIIKKWIQLGSNLLLKDIYIARCVKNHVIDELHQCIWWNEVHLEYIGINDDLETWAYISAFQMFRMDWFTILRFEYCEFTKKIRLWLFTH